MFVFIIYLFFFRKYFLSLYYGFGMGLILLDNVCCSGFENDIEECGLNGWGNNDCSYGEDVGVYCGE